MCNIRPWRAITCKWPWKKDIWFFAIGLCRASRRPRMAWTSLHSQVPRLDFRSYCNTIYIYIYIYTYSIYRYESLVRPRGFEICIFHVRCEISTRCSLYRFITLSRETRSRMGRKYDPQGVSRRAIHEYLDAGSVRLAFQPIRGLHECFRPSDWPSLSLLCRCQDVHDTYIYIYIYVIKSMLLLLEWQTLFVSFHWTKRRWHDVTQSVGFMRRGGFRIMCRIGNIIRIFAQV